EDQTRVNAGPLAERSVGPSVTATLPAPEQVIQQVIAEVGAGEAASGSGESDSDLEKEQRNPIEARILIRKARAKHQQSASNEEDRVND
ncbi:MAG: hypothetical protein Q9193_005942, partial [Seirophora villosa]